MQTTVHCSFNSINMNPNIFFVSYLQLNLSHLHTPFHIQIRCILSIILLMYTLYEPILWNLMYNPNMSPNTSETKFMAIMQWHLWRHTKQTWRLCLASNNKSLSICSCLIQRFSYTKMVIVQQPPVDLQQKVRVHLQCETLNFM